MTSLPPHRPTRKAVLIETALATLAAGLAIVGIDLLASVLPVVAGQAGALVALVFLGLPLLIARWRRLPTGPGHGDVLGADGPLGPAVRLGLHASLIVLPIFALGYNFWQVQVLHRQLGQGPGIESPALELQGRPPPHKGRVLVYEDTRGLALENLRDQPVHVRPACQGCLPRILSPGGRLVLPDREAAEVRIERPDGQLLPADQLAGGSGGATLEQPLQAQRGLGWLGWMLLGQLLVVALPEEMFFRGYVLSRLRTVLPPTWRLLGTPFGLAHVLAAVLFALVHLFAVPSPHRLLVFFPGLLFGWLAERSRGSVAPAIHHALANATLQVLQRLY